MVVAVVGVVFRTNKCPYHQCDIKPSWLSNGPPREDYHINKHYSNNNINNSSSINNNINSSSINNCNSSNCSNNNNALA